MKTLKISKFEERYSDDLSKLNDKYRPLIKNHLKQLLDKAKKVDPKLTYIHAGAGSVCVYGEFLTNDGYYSDALNGGYWRDLNADGQPRHKETQDLFDESNEYNSLIHTNLPDVGKVE